MLRRRLVVSRDGFDPIWFEAFNDRVGLGENIGRSATAAAFRVSALLAACQRAAIWVGPPTFSAAATATEELSSGQWSIIHMRASAHRLTFVRPISASLRNHRITLVSRRPCFIPRTLETALNSTGQRRAAVKNRRVSASAWIVRWSKSIANSYLARI